MVHQSQFSKVMALESQLCAIGLHLVSQTDAIIQVLDKAPISPTNPRKHDTGFIDIYFFNESDDILKNTWDGISMSKSDVYPLRKVEFLTCSTFVPNEFELILRQCYGANFMSEIRNKSNAERKISGCA